MAQTAGHSSLNRTQGASSRIAEEGDVIFRNGGFEGNAFVLLADAETKSEFYLQEQQCTYYDWERRSHEWWVRPTRQGYKVSMIGHFVDFDSETVYDSED